MRNTYYVCTTGDDTFGIGSFEKPWASIQRAAQIMEAGDRCLIRGGMYREFVKPKNVWIHPIFLWK